MKKNIRALFEKLKNTPFPLLGKEVGNFPLYDSLMAGTVSSFLSGEKIDLDAMPTADKETEEFLKRLRKKGKLNGQETEFLGYVQHLKELGEEIKKAIKGGKETGDGKRRNICGPKTATGIP